jgi:ribosomal protein S18 acetylase RimI-like enzyme
MKEKNSLADISFVENGPVDIAQLDELHRLIGWDKKERRTASETQEMLQISRFYVTASAADGQLVGFARVCGDPYIAQVLDVITHPDFRRRGIATECMRRVLAHLKRSNYLSVTLTDGSRIEDFYQRFGFQMMEDDAVARVWRRDTETI